MIPDLINGDLIVEHRHRERPDFASVPRSWAALVLIFALAALATFAVRPVAGQWSSPCPGGQCQPWGGQGVYVGPMEPAAGVQGLTLPPGVAAATCRVRAQEVGATGLGSGSLVCVSGGVGYVVTCFHVVEAGRAFSVQFPGQPAVQAVIQATDSANDLAVLRCAAPPNVAPLVLAPLPPTGELLVAGYGGSGVLAGFRGILQGFSRASGHTARSVVFRTPVRSGDSGGPVLYDGRLVGVVWGSADGESYATCGAPLEAIVTRCCPGGPGAGAGGSGTAVGAPRPPRPESDIDEWRSATDKRLAAVVQSAAETAAAIKRIEATTTEQAERIKALGLDLVAVQTAPVQAPDERWAPIVDRIEGQVGRLTERLDGMAATPPPTPPPAPDLSGYALRSELEEFATLAASRTPVSITTTAAATAALGLGGPLGLGLVAAAYLMRRRRGRGGPREDGFQQ